jgi:pyruvate dehydrogenase E2 component (dihydrolipoamide acetyltransferase)
MQYEMKMPDLATTESQIRIVRWLVQPGQKVGRGQPLLEVETDKATMEVEAVVNGVLTEVRRTEEEAVSVGEVIAVLETEEATSGAVPSSTVPIPAVDTPSIPLAEIGKPTAPLAGKGPVGMFARNRAAATASPPVVPITGTALTLAERVAAKRLLESKQTIPHFYLQTSFDASAIIARRKAAAPVKLTWDAFFVCALARSLSNFKRFRCRLEGDRLVPVENDAIGVAIDLDNELFVLSIPSPAGKTLAQLSDEIRRGVERLRTGDPEIRRMRPTMLTVTNLGSIHIESFIPIINPPEAAILGIGRVMPTPVVLGDGQIGVQQRCVLTLSVDHRIANGKYAGEFLAAIVKELESI